MSARSTVVVAYDISDDTRLRRVSRLLLGYGDRIQLSVFRCELTPRELVEVRGRLEQIIQRDEDQILFMDLGPAAGRGGESIESLGLPYSAPERRAVVL